jgi:RHS repeat-associated protein
MHIKPDLPCENQITVSEQTTTSHKGHQGVNRLTRPCQGRWKQYRTKYAYDTVGNRTNRTSGLGALTNQVFSFNTNDWLSTDKYDNDGNTTNSSGTNYYYDVMNRLTNVNNGQILMNYDGDGNRVSKRVNGTNFYYLIDDVNPSGYAQVLEEWIVTSTATNLSKVYNYGLDLISQRQPNVSTNYFIYDGHGLTRMLTDIGGNVVNIMVYDAYGNLIASNGVLQTAYLYSDQQYDYDLGLYYNRARLLNPNTGRFWTADITDGNNEDPLSLHKYLYAEDEPVDMRMINWRAKPILFAVN